MGILAHILGRNHSHSGENHSHFGAISLGESLPYILIEDIEDRKDGRGRWPPFQIFLFHKGTIHHT